MSSVVVLVRRFWALPAAFVISQVVDKAFFESRYHVSGHAGEHLSSATAPFAAVVMVFTLLATTPKARRQPLVLLTCAGWLLTTVLILVGNVRVIDALVRAGLARTPTSQLISSPKIDSAHGLADVAPWLSVLAMLALIAALRRYRHVSARVALGAAVLSVIFPPWILPGAGVLVLVVARVIAYNRSFRIDEPRLPAVSPARSSPSRQTRA